MVLTRYQLHILETSNTQRSFFVHDTKEYIVFLKGLVNLVSDSTTVDDKLRGVLTIFQSLYRNKWFLNRATKFRIAVFDKLKELKDGVGPKHWKHAHVFWTNLKD